MKILLHRNKGKKRGSTKTLYEAPIMSFGKSYSSAMKLVAVCFTIQTKNGDDSREYVEIEFSSIDDAVKIRAAAEQYISAVELKA
jgi:hypothetical protein